MMSKGESTTISAKGKVNTNPPNPKPDRMNPDQRKQSISPETTKGVNSISSFLANSLLSLKTGADINFCLKSSYSCI